MSKILILANDYKTIANFRMEVVQALLQAGHDVTLSLPEDSRNQCFLSMGCKVVNTEISRHGTNPIKELRLLSEYRRQIKACRPDVVLTYTVKPNIYGSMAAEKLHVPVINNVTGLGSVLQKDGLMKKLMLALQKRAYRRSVCVFFQNEGNLQTFRELGVVGAQAALLPGSGVNLTLHSFCAYPSEREHVDFIIVSRLRKDKGFDEFFAMVERVVPHCPKARFHIVGWVEEERYRQTLKRYEGSERVIYHGETTQSEVHTLLTQAHCLIHPSYHEGMANVLMEAAAAGRPCLASDIPGCREAIENGVTGYTFAAQDADALTSAVERFLAQSEEVHAAMGRAGREKMEREFDRELVIQRYLKEIEAVTAAEVGVS